MKWSKSQEDILRIAQRNFSKKKKKKLSPSSLYLWEEPKIEKKPYIKGATLDWFTDGGTSIHKKDYSHIAIVSTNGTQFYQAFDDYLPINQLEITAILTCLKDFAQEGDWIFSDSQFCINALEKGWKIRKIHLIPLFQEAMQLFKDKKINLEWISRNDNLAGHLLEDKLKRIQGARS